MENGGRMETGWGGGERKYLHCTVLTLLIVINRNAMQHGHNKVFLRDSLIARLLNNLIINRRDNV